MSASQPLQCWTMPPLSDPCAYATRGSRREADAASAPILTERVFIIWEWYVSSAHGTQDASSGAGSGRREEKRPRPRRQRSSTSRFPTRQPRSEERRVGKES